MSNIMSLSNSGKIMFPAIMIMMILQAVVASAASLVFPAGLIGAKMTKKLYLTKAGHEIYPGLSKALVSFNEKLTSAWTDEQYNQVYHSLEILQQRFQK